MMHDQDKEYVLKLAHENKVKFIRLWFTDILGFLKSFAITIDELEDALTEGVRFDGATLQGFIRSNESEMIAMPDVSTFQILPWRPKEDSVARFFCDILLDDKKHFEGDSRYILKQNMQKAAEKGLAFYTGPEIEFFFFKNSSSPETLDRGGYFDLTPLDTAADYRRQTVLTLEKMGINVISSHHEGSHSQHEIDLRHEDALSTADNIMTFKLITKEVGQLNDIYASFMPKPLANQNGSGLHIHQSLFRGDKNIFFDKNREHYLSANGEHFIAGLLHHSREFFALTNQWINSYKRIIHGFECPTHATWGITSQEAMVRIPQCASHKSNSMRVELRNPDPSCNPYLAFSAMLAAGLKGIEEKYKLPAPLDVENDLNKFEPLPTQLQEALKDFEKSDFMKETVGAIIHKKFVENKLFELHKYNRYITDYEINEYLPLL
jgi:glutamine synthetase